MLLVIGLVAGDGESLVAALKAKYAARKSSGEQIATCCVHRTLAMVWLTAALELAAAAKGSSAADARQTAAAQ